MAIRTPGGSMPRSVHGAAERATDNSAFEKLARIGFAASGVLHLLFGYIIARLAFVGGGGNADQSGALATLGSQTGGAIMLWIAAAGLVLVGAAVFAQNNPGHDRVPPYREPSPYMSASEIQTALNALDPAWLTSTRIDLMLFQPAFDPMRGDARFVQMLATLGLTEAHARAQAWRAAHPPEKAAR